MMAGCTFTTKPKNLLSKEKMTDLLYDLTIYNSLQSFNFNADTVYLHHKRADIFQKYGIDSLQFVEQNEYYRQDLEAYAKMFETVQQRILDRVEEVKKMPNDLQDEEKISRRIINMANISTLNVEADSAKEK